MSLRSDGTYRCDRCGVEVDNGSVQVATVISSLEPDDSTRPVVWHLCRETRKGAPRGCTGLALGPVTLANYYETRTPPP